jgi:hypothetical protein
VIPPALQERWEGYARAATRASRLAWLTVPIAVMRAQPVNTAFLTLAERQWIEDKYAREIGRVPRLYRLRVADRWMETVDDPYLPAGLYERRSVHRWLFDRGWPRLASLAWLWRNRAYGSLAALPRYEWQPGDHFVWRGAGDPGDDKRPDKWPTRAGVWECAVHRKTAFGMEIVAFERDRIGDSWTPRLLAGVIVGGFLYTVYLVLSGTVSGLKDPTVAGIIGTLIGYVSAKADQVVGYYFGSSSSSRSKDDTIAAAVKK